MLYSLLSACIVNVVIWVGLSPSRVDDIVFCFVVFVVVVVYLLLFFSVDDLHVILI